MIKTTCPFCQTLTPVLQLCWVCFPDASRAYMDSGYSDLYHTAVSLAWVSRHYWICALLGPMSLEAQAITERYLLFAQVRQRALIELMEAQ